MTREEQQVLERIQSNFNMLYEMNDKLTKIVDEKEAWIKELVEALKDAHPHISHDGVRMGIGNVIAKFDVPAIKAGDAVGEK